MKNKRRRHVQVILKRTLKTLFFCFRILVLMPMLVAAVEEGNARNSMAEDKLCSKEIRQLHKATIEIKKDLSLLTEKDK